jgi:2-polyprenyl-6-methoxyphenol hydroxylase-like FAD-dependent oxidoreductase
MFESRIYDAIVVGARCAGAATAMLMARAGMRVLVVDRGAYGTDTLSTHALMRGGVLQLHRWGVLPRIRGAGTPAIRSTSFHYGEDVIELPIKPAHGCDALFAPRRTILDRALVDAAREEGAELRYGHALISLVHDCNGRVTGAVLLDPAGAEYSVAAELVIGADGIGSAVARLTGAPVLHQASHATAVIYGHYRGLRATGYRWYYRPGVAAGVIPTNDGAHCVFISAPPSRFRDELRHDLDAGYRRVLEEAAPEIGVELGGAALETRLWAFAGRRGFLRQAAGPGWALVGDAGYFKDPLTAHGITDALRDAELLAEAATAGSSRAFAQYAATRDALSLPLFAATDAIASFAWDLDALRAQHQALNAAMRQEVEHLAALGLSTQRRAA